MFDFLLSPEGMISLLTLTLMEVVLGIDNIIFISVITDKVHPEKQKSARITGLAMAFIMRIILLFLITIIIGLTNPVLSLSGNEFSYRDIILIAGGVFLIYKSTKEIHDKVEGGHAEQKIRKSASFASVIIQIAILDLVFSFDSILTAIGLVEDLTIMVSAVLISMVVMVLFAGKISRLVNDYPTVKMLALAFLLMIGFLLVLEGFEVHVPKGYVYFAMAFSLFVEILNLRIRRKKELV